MTLGLIDIDRKDNFEIIGAQIAAILAIEIANQKKLADAAGLDATEWDIRIFHERSNPWEQWLNIEANSADPDLRPIANIWFDQGTFDPSASNPASRQKLNAVFNIDVYGVGLAAADQAAGHKPGDQQASFACQKGIRLCREIIMAAENRFLQLRGTVWQRWSRSITMFQVQLDNGPAIQVYGGRFALDVQFSEFAPDVSYDTLELLSIDVLRTEDGEIVLEADFDYT